jgi:hypothetical protein
MYLEGAVRKGAQKRGKAFCGMLEALIVATSHWQV